MVAEHRLNWLSGIADRVIYMDEGKISFDIKGEDFFSEERNNIFKNARSVLAAECASALLTFKASIL